jgi:hypothetical protein
MATYPDNANMINRHPDKGFSIAKRNNMVTFESANGYQRRKLLSRRLLRTFTFSYTSIDRVMMNDIENFYNARAGSFESFLLDLSHFNLVGQVPVRFEGDLTREHVIDGNNNAWFNVSVVMVEV